MKLTHVIKRNGDRVPYAMEKIENAIRGANRDATTDKLTEEEIVDAARRVQDAIGFFSELGVEEIQDAVEHTLMGLGRYDIATQYIRYRERHKERRKAQEHLNETYRQIFFSAAEEADFKRDNANINTDASMGMMLKLGAEGAKYFVDNFVLDEKTRQADENGFLHIHDKDFSLITLNCCQIDFLRLCKGGFSTGHGFLREPNSIRSYAALACIAIQSNQNDMYGGQSINCFDYAMADGIRKTFRDSLASHLLLLSRFMKIPLCGNDRKELAEKILWIPQLTYHEKPEEKQLGTISWFARSGLVRVEHLEGVSIGLLDEWIRTAYVEACKDTERQTHQAMEALIHNFNTLHSRAGAQVPFSSINYGMDTSEEGRLATRELLHAIWEGLGNGETPIFPISVFQLKDGVNYNPDDPNYDLFKLAMKVSAKRLFPNFVNLDAPYNLQYYKPGDYNSYVATMGCRTRVMSNINGPEESGRRGNFAFVTLNLPLIALESGREREPFFGMLDHYIDIAHDYLLSRYRIIAAKHAYNFPFLMGQKVWMGSEELQPGDTIETVLRHASLSIGFCGLAECLVALMGKHHGESQEAQKLGLEIVRHIRERTDGFTRDEKMNWSCFATPAESTAGSFLRAIRRKYGILPGISEHDYLTNSNHVPVYYPIRAIDKIKIEAPYHELCNAGHIAYIEMDGDPLMNLSAFETIVRAMHDEGMGYFSINHPVDRDPVCGYTGIIANECPHCHRKETAERGHTVVPRMQKKTATETERKCE